MGKKSKRRTTTNDSNGAGKKESPGHQLSEKVDDCGDDDRAIESRIVRADFEFHPWDMVWYCTNVPQVDRGDESPIYERGILIGNFVLKVDNSSKVIKVCPMNEDASDETKHIIIALVRPGGGCNVCYDKWPRAPRFAVGDNVLLNSSGIWKPAVITEFNCIETYNTGSRKVYVHSCKIDDDSTFWNVGGEKSSSIVKRPDSFRFTVDDEVVFAASRALGLVSNQQQSSSWVTGRIIGVDVVHENGYGAYEVDFSGRGRDQRCFIWKDDDQHVASTKRTPRERFFDSIVQDCDCEHFQYLVTKFSLDFYPIRDQVIALSFWFACYGSLLWLFKQNIDLKEWCCRNGGTTFNCRLAQSLFAGKW